MLNFSVDDDGTVGGDIAGKFTEGTADVGNVLKEIQMILFYI